MAVAARADLDAFGLYEPSIFQTPYETYHLLRHADPVHWDPITQSWIVTRYADVLALLNRPRQLSSALKRPAAAARSPAALKPLAAPLEAYLSHWLLDLDPPGHTRLRKALNVWFTGPALAAQAPRIHEIASEMALGFLETGGDFVTGFAHPFPIRVIAEMVGVPGQDFPQLLDWFARLSAFFERGAADPAILGSAADVVSEFDAWLADLLAQRRSEPQPDLLSRLASDPNLDDLLTPVGLRSTILLLLFAGHESSRSALASAMLAFLEHPAALAALRREPQLLTAAVEEVLRFEGPFMRQDRVAADPLEIGGRRIAAGDRVVLVLGAANRDPERFYAPDVFLVDRADNRHLAFGHGAHFCLGGVLARMEIAIGLNALLSTGATWKLGPRGYRWREHFNSRGLAWLDLEQT